MILSLKRNIVTVDVFTQLFHIYKYTVNIIVWDISYQVVSGVEIHGPNARLHSYVIDNSKNKSFHPDIIL